MRVLEIPTPRWTAYDAKRFGVNPGAMEGSKLVGALEINDCDEGPFVVGQNYSKELSRGKSWIREGRELREVDVADLAKEPSFESTEVIDEFELIDPLVVPTIDVGFNDAPDSKFIQLSIPDTSDPPFDKRSLAKAGNSGYPKVEHNDEAIFVRNTIGVLKPNSPVPALKCDLRMAVGPAMQKRKLAILYTLRRQDQCIGQGRLKIRFGDGTA